MSLGLLLLWILVAVVILVTAALVLPFGVRIEVVADGAPRLNIGVQPFGRFGPVIRVGKPTGRKEESRKPRSKRSAPPFRYLRRMPGAGLRLLSDLVRLVRVRRVSVDAQFGCDDPADTGEIYGLTRPLVYGVRGVPGASVRIEPVFGQAMLAGRAAVDLSIVPIALLPPALRFAWAVFGPAR